MARHTSNDNVTRGEFHPIRVHVGGGLPSARDLQYLLAILETSLAWSPIALASEQLQKAQSVPYSDKKRDKAQARARALREALAPLHKSFEEHLTRKYREVILEAGAWPVYPYPHDMRELPSVLGHIAELREKEPFLREEIQRLLARLFEHEERYDPQTRIRRIIQRWSLTGSDFNVQDFAEWVADQFGRHLLQTQRIEPDASIELLFDAAAIAAIIYCQGYPPFKDIVVYAAGVLRAYIGTAKQPSPKPEMKPPRLTPSMLQFMGQYDEVRLDWDGKEARLSLDLKKNNP